MSEYVCLHCFHLWETSTNVKVLRCPMTNTCHSWQVVPFEDFERLVDMVRERIRKRRQRRFLDEPTMLQVLEHLQHVRLKSALLPRDLIILLTKVRTIAMKTNPGSDIRPLLKQIKHA